MKMSLNVSMGLNSDPSLWARRAFERYLPNFHLRMMKFLFAASKEKLKSKSGFDG